MFHKQIVKDKIALNTLIITSLKPEEINILTQNIQPRLYLTPKKYDEKPYGYNKAYLQHWIMIDNQLVKYYRAYKPSIIFYKSMYYYYCFLYYPKSLTFVINME